MKIRIVKACYPTVWYANKIGEVFDATDCGTQYLLDNSLSAVYKEDCEEVLEHNSQLLRKVDRPAQEGDMVVIADAKGTFNMHRNGDIFEVGNMFILGKLSRKAAAFRGSNDDNYTVLEPIEETVKPIQPSAPSYAEVSELLHEAKLSDVYTIDEAIAELDKLKQPNDIVEHNGKQYRKVKRKASVGELVVVTDFKPEKHIPDFEDTKNGDVFTAVYLWDDGDVETSEEDGVILGTDEYSVLEPIEQSGQSETLTEVDMLANLAQEVAELKRQLSNAKTDIADLEDRVDENEKDTEELIGRINDLGDGAEAAAVVPVAVIEKVIAELQVKQSEATLRYSKYENMGEKELAQFYDGKELGFKTSIRKIEEALRNG